MHMPKFAAGRNIAMKVPPHEFEQTVAFYRDVVGLPEVTSTAWSSTETARFRFGDKILWIDRVDGVSQAEIWLEVVTDDLEAAAEHFARHGCVRRDGIEALPDGFPGFWLASPANIIHLVTTARDS
jgi:hypothetical protein